ncbi:MAG TPA: DUF4136 domain-containing protein [Steroidobacteraceae bacterium]|jgi:hypothetical protein|nr:DUF4136 domain-containing protein [Steroidobacteraceae bacterium]
MRSVRLVTLIRLVFVLLTGALLHACASKPDIRSDYDHAADFGKYRTFNFVDPLSTDKMGYSSLVTQQLKTSVTNQMQQRGYQLDTTDPDLLVNFSGRLQDKQEVQSSPSMTPYYGYRVGYYGAWPGYANDVYTVNYTMGTLNVDVVDARTKNMVWEGVAVGEVTKKHRENREAAIDKAVAGIFAKYPFQAGTAQPVLKTAEK